MKSTVRGEVVIDCEALVIVFEALVDHLLDFVEDIALFLLYCEFLGVNLVNEEMKEQVSVVFLHELHCLGQVLQSVVVVLFLVVLNVQNKNKCPAVLQIADLRRIYIIQIEVASEVVELEIQESTDIGTNGLDSLGRLQHHCLLGAHLLENDLDYAGFPGPAEN